ncbi:hypothetical protein ACS0TY_014055 [Phlomoides rotata]
MDARGSAITPNVDKGKVVRGHRSWSKVEEDALIHCLIDIVNDGWKAKNGFKAGFQRELEKNMRKMLPGTDTVVKPHINSKIHVWKKEYDDEEVWDASRRADPHLKSVCFKSWPYYSQWLEIFGKDQATGENAVDPLDLFNELLRVNLDQAGETGDKYVPRSTDILNEVDDNSICTPYDSEKRTCSKGKKRESGDADLSTLVDLLHEFMKFSKETMTKETLCTTKIDAKKEFGSKHDQLKLIESLKGINGLKVSDKLKECDELVQNTLRLEFFQSLLADEHEEYVWMLLDGRL